MARNWTKVLALAVLVTLVGVLVAACGQSSTPAAPSQSAAPSPSGASAKPAAATKKVTVGTLVDLSGPAALGGQIQLSTLQNYYKYANDQQLVPGVTFEVVSYDTRFDASKSAAGYQYLKEKGALVLNEFYIFDIEATKPLAVEDKIPTFAYSSSKLSTALPSWTFSGAPHTEELTMNAVDWMISTWDYAKQGRSPNIGVVGWDNVTGRLAGGTTEDYAKRPEIKDKVNFIGKAILPPGTMDFVEPARTFAQAKADYVFSALSGQAGSSLMKTIYQNKYPFRVMWADWGGSFWTTATVQASGGPEAVAGHYQLSLFGWKGTGPGWELSKKIINDDAKWKQMDDGSDIAIGMAYMVAMPTVDAVKRAVATVGVDKLDGTAIYNAAQKVDLDPQGLFGRLTWSDTKRSGSTQLRVYQVQPNADFKMVQDWFNLKNHY